MAHLSLSGCLWVVVLCYLLDALVVSANTQPLVHFTALPRPTPAGSEATVCVCAPNRGFWLPASANARWCFATEPGALQLLLGDMAHFLQDHPDQNNTLNNMPLESRMQQPPPPGLRGLPHGCKKAAARGRGGRDIGREARCEFHHRCLA